MSSNIQAEKLWHAFRTKRPDVGNTYSAWAFGDGSKQMADELCALVVQGKKNGNFV